MPDHWIKWGFYERYAENSSDPNERIRVQRYRCRITRHSFSLLPDSLLPYHYASTTHLLQWLYAMLAKGEATSALARRVGLLRETLRGLKRRFLKAVGSLRLPGRPAALSPPEFLKTLARMASSAVETLFRSWKELEPKHSVAGIYPR